MLDVVGVEQGQQCVGLGVEVAGRSAACSSTRTCVRCTAAACDVAGLRIAVGGRQQRAVGVDEADPLPAEGEQPVQRRCVGAQRRRAEQKGLLTGPFVLVEQHHHQAGPAAEPAEQRAFADAGGRGDVVHRDGVGAALGDQVARSA